MKHVTCNYVEKRMAKRPWIDDSQNADKEDAVNRVFLEGLKNVLQHVATSIGKNSTLEIELIEFDDFGCSKS